MNGSSSGSLTGLLEKRNLLRPINTKTAEVKATTPGMKSSTFFPGGSKADNREDSCKLLGSTKLHAFATSFAEHWTPPSCVISFAKLARDCPLYWLQISFHSFLLYP